MRAVLVLLALSLTVVAAVPPKQSVIVGGSVAVISQYPSVVGLLYSSNGINFYQVCVGTIVTTKSILTAAHCVYGDAVYKWRARAGSSWANSGGTVYALNSFTIHPTFTFRTMNNDIAILRTPVVITNTNVIKPVSIAGVNYNLPDNQVVWAVGWGTSLVGAAPDEKLRHIEGRIISEHTCSSKYAAVGANVTSDMLCFGWPYGVSRNRCQGDSGSPVYHHTTLVGISSWGYGCDIPGYPGVNTRISKLSIWIQENSPVF
ncbi:trypsin, alkaline B-like isoform X2 [Spodoptera frugiperda]|uniref:Trypsin, alkaline B-like isoform X2 n=1 Tax=Spodoptera frugiperda TaxID=7108 RepID=A0A9R0EYF2_SPOFR|nr:trypsin, alkaline B-like isoform X2 [Spodoptera frugiperda]